MPLYLPMTRHARDTAREFMAEEGAIKSQLRHWRDIGCKDGFGHALWRQFAEMGFTGILVPGGWRARARPCRGGNGVGGNGPQPDAVAVPADGGGVRRGDQGKRAGKRWLPGILAGDTVAAVAVDEGRKHRPEAIAMRAERSGNGFRLSGEKISWCRAGRPTSGRGPHRRHRGRDRRPDPVRGRERCGRPRSRAGSPTSGQAARLTFDNVEVDADAVVGEVDEAGSRFLRVLNAGRTGVAAEQVGLAAGAMDMTVDYLKPRTQFGVPIGSSRRSSTAPRISIPSWKLPAPRR